MFTAVKEIQAVTYLIIIFYISASVHSRMSTSIRTDSSDIYRHTLYGIIHLNLHLWDEPLEEHIKVHPKFYLEKHSSSVFAATWKAYLCKFGWIDELFPLHKECTVSFPNKLHGSTLIIGQVMLRLAFTTFPIGNKEQMQVLWKQVPEVFFCFCWTCKLVKKNINS